MKTYHKTKIFFILFMLIQGFTSCKKDLLNTTPTDQLAVSTFWKTPDNADQGLTALYAYLLNGGGGYSVTLYTPMAWDTFSDDCYSQYDYGGGTSSLASGLTPLSGGFVNDYYIGAYNQIAAENAFLANVGKVLTGDKLNAYKGEAYFLRGFNYLMLAQLYGNVPITTDDPTTVPITTKRPTSLKADVLKQAESDLNLAITSLPDVAYGTGHAVKTTAMGYMVKLLLVEQRFADAATMANQIISGHKYSLNTDYLQNFYKPGQNTSPEIMFSVKYQLPTIYHSPDINLYIGVWKGYLATQDLINEFEAGDPRLKMNFFFSGDTQAQGWNLTTNGGIATPGKDSWITGFYPLHKWINSSILDPSYSTQTDADFVLLRYADVLLMYAEAQNEASGPDNTVYSAVNLVRSRTGVNMPGLTLGLSQTDMRLKIRHERRVEFPMEGFRYFDLKRWGLTTQKLNGFIQNPLFPAIKTKYQSNYDLWPIPQAEVDRNSPSMKQNPGY
ncbi:RagB/SusD family nutrient uptake outer membrane protein [Mucilaginibacter sp. SP1R1]|uniref:RagB/SusD family nutrient uptake outer membrane protein n=1 Tax=Mucilaginibacter sp. SP1R1 TaxID=2723091 RepID=UPI00161EE909|nr:RagB/SusD family nutrient uptake outer membrane protein [Mucilaginibacter sp. SP1R1]MBB6148377.1 hypothetical protein [Mucilaginibacter sp. SP1R1]